jgi:putative spermidine/putrescine transport system permease protein
MDWCFALFSIRDPVSYFAFFALDSLVVLQTMEAAYIRNIFNCLQEKSILDAYWLSIRISAATALGGGIFGFLLAYSVTVGGLPKPLRSALITFSGVASNFCGCSACFCLYRYIRAYWFVTALVENLFGVNLYRQTNFDLYSFLGLSLTYMYFQFPLMVDIMAPALDG